MTQEHLNRLDDSHNFNTFKPTRGASLLAELLAFLHTGPHSFGSLHYTEPKRKEEVGIHRAIEAIASAFKCKLSTRQDVLFSVAWSSLKAGVFLEMVRVTDLQLQQ